MAKSLFNRTKKDPTGSDETAPYRVKLNRETTVDDFINAVLKRTSEWGYIEILDDSKKVGDVDYRHGEIEGTMTIKKEYLDRPVVSVAASGGWTRMDYIVNI